MHHAHADLASPGESETHLGGAVQVKSREAKGFFSSFRGGGARIDPILGRLRHSFPLAVFFLSLRLRCSNPAMGVAALYRCGY